MNYIKSKISNIGAILAVFGIISSLLSIFNYNLKLLMWVDIWGTTTGWIIRISMILAGAALFFLFNSEQNMDTDEHPPE